MISSLHFDFCHEFSWLLPILRLWISIFHVRKEFLVWLSTQNISIKTDSYLEPSKFSKNVRFGHIWDLQNSQKLSDLASSFWDILKLCSISTSVPFCNKKLFTRYSLSQTHDCYHYLSCVFIGENSQPASHTEHDL